MSDINPITTDRWKGPGYRNLKQEVAWDVALKLEQKRFDFTYWLCVLSGVIITLGGPTLLKFISDENNSPLLIVGIIGFSLAGFSIIIGILDCAIFYYAGAINPHYYYLEGRGKGCCRVQKKDHLWRSAVGPVLEPLPRIKEEYFMELYNRHKRLDKWTRGLLIIQSLSFSLGLIFVLIATLWFFSIG